MLREDLIVAFQALPQGREGGFILHSTWGQGKKQQVEIGQKEIQPGNKEKPTTMSSLGLGVELTWKIQV